MKVVFTKHIPGVPVEMIGLLISVPDELLVIVRTIDDDAARWCHSGDLPRSTVPLACRHFLTKAVKIQSFCRRPSTGWTLARVARGTVAEGFVASQSAAVSKFAGDPQHTLRIKRFQGQRSGMQPMFDAVPLWGRTRAIAGAPDRRVQGQFKIIGADILEQPVIATASGSEGRAGALWRH